MAGTKNTISSLVEQFLRLQNNSMEIISKLQEATTSSNDTVQVSITGEDGEIQNVTIPSFGFLKSEINRVDLTTQQLAGLGDASTVIRLPDGTTKKIFEASIIRDPEPIPSMQVPAQFKIKNNWFFESFLNPLLFVSFDVTGKVPDDMQKAVVKRIILNADSDVKKNYFDTTYKGKNDIDYAKLLVDLDANGIDIFTDDAIVDLPTSVMRFRGHFDVFKVVDEVTNVTSNGSTITVKKRKYKLNKLHYTDILAGTIDSKTLQLNDILLTADGSKYRIDSLDAAENTVVLKRISGAQPVTIGTSILTIYSPPFTTKDVQVNVGFDERQVIFLKPIDFNFNVAASQYSPGTAFWSNELLIATPTGNVTLEEFYKTQVTDFGLQFINAAKEKHVPSVLGLTPDAPVLNPANFKVVQTNSHKKDTKETEDIKQKLSTKVALQNEIAQVDEAINNKKNDLNNNASTKSDAERRKIKADIETLSKDKSSKVNLHSSVVTELNTKVQENPAVSEAAKFSIRGFWPIPSPKTSNKTQDQEVIGFRIAYRYIRKDGNAPGTEAIEFVDNDGSTKRGFFSNWTEKKSDIRKRIFNPTSGFYEWQIENVADADTVNVNQLDIPISKGEKVQVRIKSISEAGWPLNPLESDWSDVQTIDFPDDLQIADQSTTILQNINNEATRLKFQDELNSRGLDLHLLNAFTSGDKYFAHTADAIASGFFTPENKVINLFDKLNQLTNDLNTLRQLVQKAKGALSVFLLDEAGNVTKITANSTTKLFAGYYKDLIASGSGLSITYNHGQIITKNYILRIENSAATALELASLLPGGIATAANISDGTDPKVTADYNTNRKYDLVPMSLTATTSAHSGDIKQVAPFQSSQAKALWLYGRQKSVGLDEDLFVDDSLFWNTATVPVNAGYSYTGQTVDATPLVPINGYELLPFNPLIAIGGAGTDPDVWNGTIIGTTANGSGFLTEFCIHKDHPDLVSADTISTYIGGTSFDNIAFKTYRSSDWNYDAVAAAHTIKYQKFAHAVYFSNDVNSVNTSNVNIGKKQLSMMKFGTDVVQSTGTGLFSPDDRHFPAKLGFAKNDEFLVGKYTCGAYLFLAPSDHTDVSVDGSTDLAKTLLEFGEDKGINIPLIFQFRCSDKLQYVGGFRTNGTITNITYSKKVGIDIQVRNESLFSFDVEVTTKYVQDSLVQSTYIPNVALDRLNAIRTASQGQ